MVSTPNQAIQAALQHLATARLGLEDYLGSDARRRVSGLHSSIVFGRAVTNALQNMRGKVEGFDEWYGPKQVEMGADPGFRALYKLRSDILKQVEDPLTHAVQARMMDTSIFDTTPQPEGTLFGAIDTMGGPSFIVERPDGSRYQHYIEIPASWGWRSFLSVRVGDEEVDLGPLVQRHLDYMRALIDEAQQLFTTPPDDSELPDWMKSSR